MRRVPRVDAREPSLSPRVPVHACARTCRTSGVIASFSLTEHFFGLQGGCSPGGWARSGEQGSHGMLLLRLLGQTRNLSSAGSSFHFPFSGSGLVLVFLTYLFSVDDCTVTMKIEIANV